MVPYTPPLPDIAFTLRSLCGLESLLALPGLEEVSPDLVDTILEEAGAIAAEALAPLNPTGDREGARLLDGKVQTPDGWRAAWQTLVAGAWNALPFPAAVGGMDLPWLVNTAVQEMWQAANMAFGLCPMLTQGAADALLRNGSETVKALFLPKLVSGEWTGTMNLTEPQAGSDLSAIRTRATPEGDHYRISGQKIFITYGDHDLSENIVHLVLARTPGAPAGVKGISLFVVPKFRIDDTGRILGPNDVRCVSLEHKLGIHASPTAVLAFGDHEGAIGYRVGEENRGLEAMFVMMNHARLSVGVQGLAIAERAYQQARAYACERVQGRPVGAADPRAAIVHHPDVRRMLMVMKAQVEAMRAAAYDTAATCDHAHRAPDPAMRRLYQQRFELLTPIIKGWCTETGNAVASLGVQVHGGMGYSEETGAAQHLRDARITTIYEGTTGIQANDLVYRKVLRDRGAAMNALLAEMRSLEAPLAAVADPAFPALRQAVTEGAAMLEQATAWILDAHDRDPVLPAAAAVPFLLLAGTVVGGWESARAALAAAALRTQAGADPGFLTGKIATAAFYAEALAPAAASLARTVTQGSAGVMALTVEQL